MESEVAGPKRIVRTSNWEINLARAMTGTWLHAIARIALYIAITKVAGLEELGAWALGVGIAEPVLKLTNMGLRQVHATDTDRQLRFSHILLLRIVMLVLALSVCLVVVVTNTTSAFTIIIVAAVLSRVAESLSDVALGEYQRSEAFIAVFASGAARLLATLAAVALLFNGYELESVLLSMVALMLLLGLSEISIAYIIDRMAHGVIHSNNSLVVRQALKGAMHLGFTASVVSYMTHVNRYAANWFGTLADVGIIAIAAVLVAFGQTFIRGISIVLLPALASRNTTTTRLADNAMCMAQASIMIVTALLGLVMSFFGGPVIALLFSADAGMHATLIGAIFAASGIRYASSLQNVRLMAARSFSVQTPYAAAIFALGTGIAFASYAVLGIWGVVLSNVLIWAGIYILRSILLGRHGGST